ncbi:MAG: hypothetical protein WCK15_23325 [Pirellula sp.]
MRKNNYTAQISVSNQPIGDASVNVEYLGVDNPRLDAIRLSASDLVSAMFENSGSAQHCDCVWPLMDAIWPARSTNAYRHFPRDPITLTLVPLSRIGQMEGKSGSLVLIGSFRDNQNLDMPTSHPIVVKTAPISAGKLKPEYDNALSIRPFTYQHKDVFSIPFRRDEKGGFDVLWSLFSASDPLWSLDSDATLDPSLLKVRDLRDLLDDNKLRKAKLSLADTRETVSQILKTTYSTMRNLHIPFGRKLSRKVKVLEEYDWYLRGYPTVWGKEWESVFGQFTCASTRFAGKDWANPVWLIDQLKDLVCSFTFGAIHGDLHSGNVVITSDNQPRIIDFGWAKEESHIAKDFVLMECNLRFLFLRPQLASEDIDRLASWIQNGVPIPDDLSPYSKDHCSLILVLQSLAREALGEEVDWNREYLLPLFLVAFGLLRFAPQLGNQQAAILTVLALATHIKDCGILNRAEGVNAT